MQVEWDVTLRRFFTQLVCSTLYPLRVSVANVFRDEVVNAIAIAIDG